MKGNYLERTTHSTATSQTYTVSSKITFFYKESVVYPYVNFKESMKGLILISTDYIEVIHFVEQNNFCHL